MLFFLLFAVLKHVCGTVTGADIRKLTHQAGR
uniref:Uncharacterized protein n=1 Tax=Anguilla anguilla TaxID=7936 RepID=A0A0E9TJ50_ANGAN